MQNKNLYDRPKSIQIVNGANGELVMSLSIISHAQLVLTTWNVPGTEYYPTVVSVCRDGEIVRKALLPLAPEQTDRLLTQGFVHGIDHLTIAAAYIKKQDDGKMCWSASPLLDVSRESMTTVFEPEDYVIAYRRKIKGYGELFPKATTTLPEQFAQFAAQWKNTSPPANNPVELVREDITPTGPMLQNPPGLII